MPATRPRIEALTPETRTKLLAEAKASYRRRPDVASVERAEQLYRQVAVAGEGDVEAFVGAIRAIAWLVEHSDNPARREELSVSAVDLAQSCERVAAKNPECDYRLALAVGMQARERPLTATDALKRMVDLLGRLGQTSPALDDAGPHRVLALLMLRAPSWPTGPGDAETALVEAQAAVALRPDFPPNQLVLGEALHANGKREASRQAYQRALDSARAQLAAGDPDAPDWIHDAEKALR